MSGVRPPACKAHRRLQLYLTICIGELLSLAAGFEIAGRIPAFAPGMQASTPLIILAPMHVAIAFQIGAYGLPALHSWTRGLRYALSALCLSGLILMGMALALAPHMPFSAAWFVAGTVLSATGLVLVRYAAHLLSRRLLPDGPIEIVLLTDHPRALPALPFRRVDAGRLRSACALNCPESLDALGRAVGRADRVLVACAVEDRHRWVEALKGSGIDVEIVMPELEALGVLRIDRQHGQLTACVAVGQLALRQRVLKRAFDLAAVLWLLPLLLLMLLVVTIAIKLDDGGPVFFTQQRIGHGNRFFNLYKFRTMRCDMLDGNGRRSTARDDPRVTRVGALLRRTSIDELPQLLNVIAGSMSIVGPRPHATGSTAGDELFWDVDQRYWLRHAAKPGLTGLAQVRGLRGATETRAAIINRIQADLEYLAGWSLWRDVRILAATVGVLAHPNAF